MSSSEKLAQCKSCEHGTWHQKTWDWSQPGSPPAWECGNCGNVTARRENKRRSDYTMADVTPAQRKTSDAFSEEYLRWHSHYSERYEIKLREENMSEHGTFQLIIEVGIKDDEGTYNQLYSRARLQVFIGRRGGMTCYSWKTGKSRTIKGFRNCVYENDNTRY